MSGGKKRSGFQITSVTSEDGESPASKPPPDTSASPPPGTPADRATPSPIVLNGPAFIHNFIPTLLTQQSSSQPTTPVSVRKQRSLEQAGGGASRFRVVRLGQGSGEPYRRGRWTCVDVIEREAEPRGVRRVMDSMRHAHSLESLETVGLNEVEGVVGGVVLKSLNMRGLRPGLMGHLQGSAHLLTHSGPPSPTYTYHEPQMLSPPSPHKPDTPRARKVPPPLRLDLDPASKLRATRSQPTSPGPPTGRDGLFHPALTPVQTPSALALAQSMFGVGGAFELVGDDGGSSTSMVAIDNKIEQAMDLVKAHLMMAVREEVEVLREQIKELTEKNAQLERENYILKALRDQY